MMNDDNIITDVNGQLMTNVKGQTLASKKKNTKKL